MGAVGSFKGPRLAKEKARFSGMSAVFRRLSRTRLPDFVPPPFGLRSRPSLAQNGGSFPPMKQSTARTSSPHATRHPALAADRTRGRFVVIACCWRYETDRDNACASYAVDVPGRAQERERQGRLLEHRRASDGRRGTRTIGHDVLGRNL